MPVIPVFTSRRPVPPDPRRKQHVVAAVIIALVLIAALLAAVRIAGPSSTERCLAEGGRSDEGLRRCDREEAVPRPSTRY